MKRSIRRNAKAGRKPSSLFRKHLQRTRDNQMAKERRRINKVKRDRQLQLLRSNLIRFAVAVIRWIAKLFNKPADTPPPAVSVAKVA